LLQRFHRKGKKEDNDKIMSDKMSTMTNAAIADAESFSTTTTLKSKVYFNAIDNAHEILETDRELAKKVPSCVVVGMQSVGKSAILSRISGISFPQDSEVCTRVAIELRLRRSKEVKPMTIKAGNLTRVEIDKDDHDAIESALKDAQLKVLNGRDFEDKLSVKVEKDDVDLPEVTLIDLPGVFFAKDNGSDDLEKMVKDMIQERVANEMALILHVVPLNQDTDTISTWRTVREADDEQKRTISVLTKADLALKSGKDNLQKRIQKIMRDSGSSECFIVHGAATSIEQEESQLAAVSKYIEELDLQDSIQVGIKALNEYIEDRMLKHIKEKLPEMRGLLENELHRIDRELNDLGRKPFSPLAVSRRDSEVMRQHLVTEYESFLPEYRRCTERMTQALFKLDMEPLGIVDATEANSLLKSKYKVSHIHPSPAYYKSHVLALEVKKISEDTRVMLNVPYVGQRLELERWLEAFVKPLEQVVKKYIEDLFSMFNSEILQPSLRKGSSDFTKVATIHLEALLRKEVIVAGRKDAMVYVEYMIQAVKTNTFTTNDHYLSDTTTGFQNDFKINLGSLLHDSYKLEMQPYFHLVFGIRAFLKTRKKMLPDTIQLHFTKALGDLLKETDKKIGDYMMSESSIATMEESKRAVVRRKMYLEREQKIKDALDEISLL